MRADVMAAHHPIGVKPIRPAAGDHHSESSRSGFLGHLPTLLVLAQAAATADLAAGGVLVAFDLDKPRRQAGWAPEFTRYG
jgi:hypothetical protein